MIWLSGSTPKKKIDPKTLHRFLDRRLLVEDSILEVYRAFVDRPG